MAKSETEGGKRGRKAAMKAAGSDTAGGVAVAEQSETVLPPPRAPGRKKTEAAPKTISFMERLSSIAAADWGTRAKVTVYRLTPITNNLMGSEKKYIKVYTQPPVTEERIKQDCGSGRYRLYLTFKAPAENEKELDSVEIDILDLNFPPRVPKGAWLDDPRNAEWAWAKEIYEKQNQPPQAQPVQQPSVYEAVNDALDLAERLNGEKGDPVKATLETIKGVKDLFPAPPPSNNNEAMLGMLSGFLKEQLATSRAETQELRAELRSMRDNKTNTGDNGITMVKTVVESLKDLVPSIKEIVPGLGEGKSRLGPWQELVVAVTPHAAQILSPFANVFAQVMAAKVMQQNNGAPQPQPGMVQQQPAALPGAPPNTMMPFLQMIAMPMMNYVRLMAPPANVPPEEIATDFASWVYDGFSADPRYEQAMLAARSMGVIGLLAAFRGTPLWMDKGPNGMLPSLAELETKLQVFFKAFLDWKPEDPDSEDEPGETDPVTPNVVDFDANYQEA